MGATLVAAGALVGAYLLDPARGHARRTRIAAGTERLAGRTRARITRATPLMNRGEARQEPADWPDEAPPDVDSES